MPRYPYAIDLRFPPIPIRPSADEIEAFAPELGELGDRHARATLQSGVDFDLELFEAASAILEGAPEAEVLGMVTPSHPGAAEAVALLEAAYRRRWSS